MTRPTTIYEPDQRRLPPLGDYLRDLWNQRAFGIEMARAEQRARHRRSRLGQVWTVLNPTLLAGVYYLVFGLILGGPRGNAVYLAQLLGGLFFFYFTRNAASAGAKAIIGQTGLVTSTTIPRALLPLSSTLGALLDLGPMLAVYAVLHLAAGLPVTAALLWLPAIIGLQTVFTAGLALGLAALTVQVRDIALGLPYALRMWLYLSPILYRTDDIVDRVPDGLRVLIHANPMVPILSAYQSVLLDGTRPTTLSITGTAVWAILALLLGGWLFLSRERDFALHS